MSTIAGAATAVEPLKLASMTAMRLLRGRAGSDFDDLVVVGLARSPAFRVLLEELNADLLAVHPAQLAAPIGEAGGRQQQEEFLQRQSFDVALHGELRSGFGNVLDEAASPPCAGDAHHVRCEAAFENDSFAFASLCRHFGNLRPLYLAVVVTAARRGRQKYRWRTNGA